MLFSAARHLLALATAVSFGAVGLASAATAVCTTSQVTDIVRNVAGDRLEVIGLLGEGVDPHLYTLTRSEVAQLLRADIVFYNGLLLEGKMTDALGRVEQAGKPVHALAESLTDFDLLHPEAFEGHADPHVWMDVDAWIQAAEVVRDALIAFDPDGEPAYRANCEAHQAELAEVDVYANRVLGSVPDDARILVTAHDAFNYFGRAHGFEVQGIQGISTESEAGLRRIEELVDLLVEQRVAAVFVETSVSERNVQALIDGAAAQGHTVRIGGSLFSDAMGPAGTYEGTYVGMIDHNVSTIAHALGGDVPPRGMSGMLSTTVAPAAE